MAEYSNPKDAVRPRLPGRAPFSRPEGFGSLDEGDAPLSKMDILLEVMKAKKGHEAEQWAGGNPIKALLYDLMGGQSPGTGAMFMGTKALNAPRTLLSAAARAKDMGAREGSLYRATSRGGNPGISTGAEGMQRWEISDEGAKLLMPMPQGSLSGKLRSILHHPELFDNYPRLENYDVVFTRGPAGSQPSGEFSGKLIKVTAENEKDALQTLLHEIQHGVQGVEGFARGGNPDGMRKWALQYGEGLTEQLDYMAKELKASRGISLKRAHDELEASNPAYKEIQAEAVKILENVDDPKEVYRLYRRLMGETEARNTAKRAGMSLGERAKSHPTETEDIPRALQIR